MTPADFRAWRKAQGFNQQQAAEALGLSTSALRQYERGRRYDDHKPVIIPKTVRLAMLAITAGLNWRHIS